MSKHSGTVSNEDGLVLSGYQKKLKTMKRKFFTVYKETLCNVARLEYYDNERKFKSGLTPKRVIELKHCFNINRRLDTKYDYVIALSTKDGGFGVVFENKEEMLNWLELLITLQRFTENISDSIRPHFEHVWQVMLQKKGLAEDKGIVGYYHACLTPKSVTFIRIGPDKTPCGINRISNIEFLLTTIRRCGDSQCFFYMEVGRQSIIGPGELWMETEDSLIAQNMHQMILSAMSAKNDSNMEPMRKRSSSANEASKPINVLQRRQTQPENKMHNSPQTTLCFGRERCDSLPSRNRTYSECSNQSLSTSSIITVRNTSMSGLRPHSYQRHSNSPPLSSTIGCSESEESSISFDEPDESGGFISYRFNSRSSDGVIPEENTDELLSSENKSNEKTIVDLPCQSLKSPQYVTENYLSMAPLKNTKDFGEKMKFKNQHFLNSVDETKCASSYCAQYRNSYSSNIEFSEFTTDNISKTLFCDVDSQSDRPTRAYSIGSKIEQNKVNSKRIDNTNETDQVRVRAFSVGSRAKIPRCGLQRGVLSEKPTIEKHFNSNNNMSCVSDAMAYNNQFLNTNAFHEKKSISAPLLIHKSHNAVDHMSDLMEIDFSRSTNNTIHRLHYPSTKSQFSKSVPNASRNQVIIPENRREDLITVSSLTKTDNGYLEMKPVGNSSQKPQAANISMKIDSFNSIEYLGNKPKKLDGLTVPENKNQSVFLNTNNITVNIDSQTNIIKSIKTTQPIVNQKIKEDICTDTVSKIEKNCNEIRDILSSDKKTVIDALIIDEKAFNLTSKYKELSLNTTLNLESDNLKKGNFLNKGGKFNEYFSTNIKDVAICTKLNNQKIGCHDTGKLEHSISDEDYKHDYHCAEKKSIKNNDSGYEILQIKSDSSLQSHKVLNRPIRKEKQQNQLTQIRPRSTNSSSLMSSSSSSSSTLCGCTSSSTSCLNSLPSPPTHSKELNHSSRPPSVGSEHELYYASLDLPQCNIEISSKASKSENLYDSSQTDVCNVNNSYAKIDFDISDSSSSSSKNLNF